MASKTHKSPWTKDFIRNEDAWICSLCKVKVKAPLGNTTNLKSHLKNQHKTKFDEIMSSIAAKEVDQQKVSIFYDLKKTLNLVNINIICIYGR